MSRKHSVAISQARIKGKIFSSKTNTELSFFLLGNKNLYLTAKQTAEQALILTETPRYIDRGHHLENPKSVFDSSQLSGSINVQDGGLTSFSIKKSGIALQNTPALQANYKVKYDTCSFTVRIELMGVSDRGQLTLRFQVFFLSYQQTQWRLIIS